VTAFSNILVLGRDGQIGSALTEQLPLTFPDARLTATEVDEIDLTQNDSMTSAIRALKPDLIINAAAYTAVDRAESDVELAYCLNGFAPGLLAEEAKRCGALLIHYSTDYVFDGEKTTPYIETDSPNPLNEYGKSKRAGEIAIEQTSAAALILRTSWVYGLRGKNFFLTMLRLAQERDELRIVNDQTGVPNESDELAALTVSLVRKGIDFLKERSGLYHLSAGGQTTWFGFAQAIFEDMPKCPRLIPIATREYPLPAKRPVYGVLSAQHLMNTFSLEILDWRASLMNCQQRRSLLENVRV
jgi:dTDP-4-dehydrorhamnose reductase